MDIEILSNQQPFPCKGLSIKLEGKLIPRARLRTVILLSPIMILVGFLLTYIALFTSVLHTETGLINAQTGALGLALVFMGIVMPIVRLWQERSRRR